MANYKLELEFKLDEGQEREILEKLENEIWKLETISKIPEISITNTSCRRIGKQFDI